MTTDATAVNYVLVARRYDSGDAVRVEVREGVIADISPTTEQPTQFVAPGFVDLQVNGYQGRDFASPQLTLDDVAAISFGLDRHGVTGYLATVTTNRRATITHALAVIDTACRTRPEIERRVWGVHLEGPYISSEYGPRGAHPREHCRPPDWDEFSAWQAASGGRIQIVTLSPEYEEAPAFIAKAVAGGVLVAIGHTKATSAQIQAAVEAGARMSTHLGNGAHPQIRRHPNYIWDQLADDRLTASIIADGHHLPPAVVKSFVRAKTPGRVVLVSDITGMGGMPPGRYRTVLGEVEVLEDGKLVVAGQRDLLAGAALAIEHCIPHVMRCTDVELPTAIDMASVWPARLIGVNDHELRVGTPANLVVFSLPLKTDAGPLVIHQTINQGEMVWDDLEGRSAGVVAADL
jgi:N-acetylglucosamine-6-phosphate deacetylase